MGNKGSLSYEVDGAIRDFDFETFRRLFDEHYKRVRTEVASKTKLEEDMGKAVCADSSTVHN